MMEHLGRNGWLFGAWALLLVGALLRINNALHFPVDMGFDATGNWDYIQRLLKDWRLPLPEERWSTSHPPLFYYLSAAIGRLLDDPGKRQIVVTLRLLSSAAGLIIVGLAVALVRRLDPGNARRVLLCAALFAVKMLRQSQRRNEICTFCGTRFEKKDSGFH